MLLFLCCPEEGDDEGVYLGTILPSNTTGTKITTLLLFCSKQEMQRDELDLFVGSSDGTIDIFKINVSFLPDTIEKSNQIEVIHLRHLRGNVGPIDWMCGIGHLFISKSSLSKRKKFYTDPGIFNTYQTSQYIPRTTESFKNKDTEVDLAELLKRLSIQLAQSLRMMRNVASKPLLEKGFNYLDTSLFSKLTGSFKLSTNKTLEDFSDYDILFWNIASRQCIRKIRQRSSLDRSPIPLMTETSQEKKDDI